MENVRVLSTIFVGLSLTVAAVVVSNSYKEDIPEYLEIFNGWIASLGVFGPVVLSFADLIAVVLCFPFAASLEVAAGFLFGVAGGTVVVVVGKVSGAALAFLLGRTLLRDFAHKILIQTNYLNQVHNAMISDSFKLAILMRLSPVPSCAVNYCLALSPISFKDFFFATLFAGFPNILKNVYGGSFMRSALTEDLSQLDWYIRIGTGVLTAGATVLLTRYLVKYAKAASQSDPSPSQT